MRLDLTIDADRAIAAIGSYLSEAVNRSGAKGLLMGLSGGLDSSVLAAIAARAVGPERLHVAYLHDADSSPEIAGYARLMAENLGLDLEVMPITDEMRARGVYRPLFIKALRLHPVVARISSGSYRMICGESPFKSTLRTGGGARLTPWYKRAMFSTTIRHLDEGFTVRHVYRRALLETWAAERELLLIGGANRSETEVGWFVKDGIDDLPIQPMTGLFKTQVRQLAAALELPEPVRLQLPSPDMAPGVSDEFGIGHDYAIVDIVIDALDQGMDEDAIAALGIRHDEIRDIRDLMRLSAWKRTGPHEMPPISGRFGSDLRR